MNETDDYRVRVRIPEILYRSFLLSHRCNWCSRSMNGLKERHFKLNECLHFIDNTTRIFGLAKKEKSMRSKQGDSIRIVVDVL